LFHCSSEKSTSDYPLYPAMYSASGVSTKDLQRARQYAKKKRASVACSRCKNAKTRCSDYRPCSRCKKSGVVDSCTNSDSSVDHSPDMDFTGVSHSAFSQQDKIGGENIELANDEHSHVNRPVVQNLPEFVPTVSTGFKNGPFGNSALLGYHASSPQEHHGLFVEAHGQATDELNHRILHFAQSLRTPSNLMMLQAQSFQPLPTMPYAPRIHPAWPSPWLLPTPAPPPYSALHLGGPPVLTPPIDALHLMLALAATAGAARPAGPPLPRF
jgi:hypothetical protein